MAHNVAQFRPQDHHLAEPMNEQISVPDSLPDYYCGRLIYYDESNGMPWIVYDGAGKTHFSNRKAAEKYCIEQATQFTKEEVGEWMRAHAHLIRAQSILDSAIHFRKKEPCERIALQIRLLADQLDEIIATNGL